jgi:hypothetical protein
MACFVERRHDLSIPVHEFCFALRHNNLLFPFLVSDLLVA